tara:strand:- start:14 stop:199 length:186 start_codon:yes stop_codon:yes gene_type:complete
METNYGCFSSHRVEVYNYKNANSSAGYKVFTPQQFRHSSVKKAFYKISTIKKKCWCDWLRG